MRKIFSLIIILAAIATTSCESADSLFSTTVVERDFTATLDDITRTAVDASGKIQWEAGDIIRYFSAPGGTVGSAIAPSAGISVNIRVQTEENAPFLIAEYGGNGITDNTDGNSFSITGAVNATQSGRFRDAHVSVAMVNLDNGTEYQSLNFRNVTSLIKFTLERSDIAKVVFRSSNGETIHDNGTIRINFNGTDATASFCNGGGSEITVNTSGAGTFYIATLPVNLEKGFIISCFGSDGIPIGAASSAKFLEIKKNSIVDLGTLDSRIKTDNIVFKDDKVKAICVANWDGNGDGELSYSEAAAISNLGNRFHHSGISSFDELEYFTGITEIPENAFWGCTLLTSVIIPKGVTSLEYSAFRECESLTSIVIPEGVYFDDTAFHRCTRLETVVIMNGVTRIGKDAFSSCSSLCNVTIPDSVTELWQSAFRDNLALKTIHLPEKVSFIGQEAFYNCGLTSVTIHKAITRIGDEAFRECNYLNAITIEATTPPELGDDVFLETNGCPIFVPAECVDLYKSSEYWDMYKDRIKPASTF